jgi:rhodanese-related sulfurtransferase
MVILFAVLSGCLGTKSEKPATGNFTTISVQEAKGMIDRGEVFILDVRTQEEYDAGHINRSTLIPVQVIETRLNEIPRDQKVLVYCRSGRRSSDASKILVNNSFKEIYNMNGGIDDWIRSGFEVVK